MTIEDRCHLRAAALAALLAAVGLGGPAIGGDVEGVLVDAGAYGVPQMRIELCEEGGMACRTGYTDEAGAFLFTGVPEGRHELRLTDDRGRTARQDVSVSDTSPARVRLILPGS